MTMIVPSCRMYVDFPPMLGPVMMWNAEDARSMLQITIHINQNMQTLDGFRGKGEGA